MTYSTPHRWIALVALATIACVAPARAAEQVHWTVMGPGAVSFDWVGLENSMQYGLTPSLGQTKQAYTPSPMPWDSNGPFKEARLTGLLPDTLYHWRIGLVDGTFRTPRAPGRSDFVVYAEGDIGSTLNFWRMGVVQQQIADGDPAFVLGLGDISYANSKGFEAIRTHFNDVMVWSRDAAYMTVWGNHEWDGGDYDDDLRNYKGRFDFPNSFTSPGVPATSCCGEDWYWFDYGNVRFIAYPELFPGAFADWRERVEPVMAEAQGDPNITFIVTFGHRPAYSSGRHPGSPSLKEFIDELGAMFPKYRLNLNGHSHNYERTYPQNGVVHVTAGGGGSHMSEEDDVDCRWRGGCPPPSYSAFRGFRHGPVRLEFSADQIKVMAICGPPGDEESNHNDILCDPGTVFDSTLIRITTPDGTIDSPSADVAIEPGESVTFAASGFDPDGHYPLTYRWDFDGGAPNVEVEDPGPVTFPLAGVYEVRMTVVESQGYADPTPATRIITVGDANQAPDGIIVEPAGDLTIPQGQAVIFSGSGTDPEGEALHYYWDFEGGAAKTYVQNPGPVTFARGGTFEVSLTVTDPHGLADPTPAFRTITVLGSNQPPVSFISSPAGDDTIEVGHTVNFEGSASDPDGNTPLTYHWDFDGAAPDAAVEDPGPVTFMTPGLYLVLFHVTDGLGLSNPDPPERAIWVFAPNQLPVAQLELSARTGNEPLDVFVDAGGSIDPDGSIASYYFQFGDGGFYGPGVDPTVSHRYRAGTWTAEVIVTDDRGGTHAASLPVIVADVGPGPNLVGNPSVESSLTGWVGYQGATITQVPGGFDGSQAIQVRGPDTLRTYGVQDSPNWIRTVPADRVGVPYRFQAWVRSSTHTHRVRLQVREFNNSVKVGETTTSPYLTLTPEWQLLEVTHTALQEGSTLDFHVLGTPDVPNELFLVDNVSIRSTGETTAVGDLDGAGRFAVVVAPNPMRVRGSIAFRMPESGRARVHVLDLGGRLVRTMLDEPWLEAGTHRVTFDGRDESGRTLASGMYFYRVFTDSGAATRRFVYVR